MTANVTWTRRVKEDLAGREQNAWRRKAKGQEEQSREEARQEPSEARTDKDRKLTFSRSGPLAIWMTKNASEERWGDGRQQEGQVDDGLCAEACDQVKSTKEMTRVQCTVEKFESLMMMVTSVKMLSTKENRQRAAETEESLKRLMEEAQPEQEEIGAGRDDVSRKGNWKNGCERRWRHKAGQGKRKRM